MINKIFLFFRTYPVFIRYTRKNSLYRIVFVYNECWKIQPYITTNQLNFSSNHSRSAIRKKNLNKHFDVSLKIGKKYYKNSFGLDRKVVNRCINLAGQCKKLKIPITTFMIASDPYLQNFVQEFTEMNNGKAFYASLDKLGAFLFNDFESGKRKTLY